MTLAWTDPPGDPAAAIKLVNNLDLIVTNLDNPTNPVVYYGNDIPAEQHFNTPRNRHQHAAERWTPSTTSKTSILPQPLGTNYSVTVIGRARERQRRHRADQQRRAGITRPTSCRITRW